MIQNSPNGEAPEFPTEKWDHHIFTPTGEEIIIAGESYFKKDKAEGTLWKTGPISELFTLQKVDDSASPLPFTSLSEENSLKAGANDRFLGLSNLLMDELRKFFRPELINRFDEVVIFRPLTREHMGQIVNLQIRTLGKQLLEQNIAVTVTEGARRFLAKAGYDPVFGARPLRRTIQRMVENPISSLLIKGEVKSGDTLVIDGDEIGLSFNIQKMEGIKPTQETSTHAQEQMGKAVSGTGSLINPPLPNTEIPLSEASQPGTPPASTQPSPGNPSVVPPPGSPLSSYFGGNEEPAPPNPPQSPPPSPTGAGLTNNAS